jgi:hypothetical protein
MGQVGDAGKVLLCLTVDSCVLLDEFRDELVMGFALAATASQVAGYFIKLVSLLSPAFSKLNLSTFALIQAIV